MTHKEIEEKIEEILEQVTIDQWGMVDKGINKLLLSLFTTAIEEADEDMRKEHEQKLLQWRIKHDTWFKTDQDYEEFEQILNQLSLKTTK